MILLRFIVEMSAGAALCGLLAWAFFRANPDNITKIEAALRNRVAGLVIGLPALISCVPHAEIVSPGFLVPLLWPLAIVLPVLCYFYIDYYTSRAGAGALIILAYQIIHYAYDYEIPGGPVVTLAAWLYGFAAIWVSGKPCSLRDWLRLAAAKKRFKITASILAAISAITFIWILCAGINLVG